MAFTPVLFFVPFPALRYSPCYKSFFSIAITIASYGRFAMARKNSFYFCGAAAAIRGRCYHYYFTVSSKKYFKEQKTTWESFLSYSGFIHFLDN
jgi:hypothetical protein